MQGSYGVALWLGTCLSDLIIEDECGGDKKRKHGRRNMRMCVFNFYTREAVAVY